MRVESGETVVVGVNRFGDGAEPPVIPTPDYSALERGQVARVQGARASRDGDRVRETLAALAERAAPYARAGEARPHLMPAIIDAVRARATVGEISDVLRGVWGEYRPG